MSRGRASVVLAVVVAAVSAAATGGAGTARAAPPKLLGTVADPLNISLTRDARRVTRLKAGTYTIVVEDEAPDNNFHLIGPGVDRHTTVRGTGTYTWTVTLRKGTYTYRCDLHRRFMTGSFSVA